MKQWTNFLLGIFQHQSLLAHHHHFHFTFTAICWRPCEAPTLPGCTISWCPFKLYWICMSFWKLSYGGKKAEGKYLPLHSWLFLRKKKRETEREKAFINQLHKAKYLLPASWCHWHGLQLLWQQLKHLKDEGMMFWLYRPVSIGVM